MITGEEKALPDDFQADKIVVIKSERKLRLYDDTTVVREYRIALGFNPEGDKLEEGDGKTPEGKYIIDYRNPESAFHLSLHISYPDSADKAEAKRRGRNPGGEIFIHGFPNNSPDFGKYHYLFDWTLGCIAVTNEEIVEIWEVCPNGTPIEIVP